MNTPKFIYLSLGSNMGDRAAHLAAAIAALDAADAFGVPNELSAVGARPIRVLRVSSFYRTEPVDFAPQAWFLNCCVAAETTQLPRQLLHTTQRIQWRLSGRKLTPRGPRALDIDILLYGDARIRTPEFEIPHPRMAERRFVLEPLAEIAPSLHHPALGKSIAELLAECRDRRRVRRVT